jgi:ribulose-5-phosphate 4-epimerase/fuculose-1-phosphate aldolase
MAEAPIIEENLRNLARAHRILADNGHKNMSLGHMSWRDPEGRGFWLKRSGLGFEEVYEQDFILLDLDGAQLLGAGGRHAEWPIHAEIFRARPDVMAVAHSHPVHATILSSCDTELACVCHEGILLHGRTSYFRKMRGLIRTPEQGRELAEVLGESSVVLMKNHGATACGPSIELTALWAIFLERASYAQLTAAATPYAWSGPEPEDLLKGGPAHMELPEALIRDFWSYFCRRLGRTENLSG